MSHSGENFMEITSYSASQACPIPRMTSVLMDQTENGLNPICEILPQTNLSNDHQSEQTYGRFGHSLTAKRGIDLPLLGTENVSPFAVLQSPNMFSKYSSQIVPPSPVANDGPPEKVEISGGDHATMMISNNGLPHQRMGVDQAPEDQNIVYVLDVEPSSPIRRENEVSNMISATRTGQNDERTIIHMESEENNPDDGFLWRKYGRKVIKGNPCTRSYYKCTFVGCKVKKYVERVAKNVKPVVITYYGIHEHGAPVRHSAPVRHTRCFCQKNRPGSSMSQDPSNRTHQLGRSPSSSSASHLDNQNHGFMYQNDEPKSTDRVIPDGI